MTIEDFNVLVEQAYDAAFESEEALTTVYATAYLKQGERAAKTFEQITAAWTPPIIETLTYGMDEQEAKQADDIRDEAAVAILAVFATLGLASVGREFLQAISERAQLNFEQEILRNLRKIVADGFNSGLSSEETAAIIREKLPQVIPSSAQMLAETELTTLVNQQALVAANKAFPDGVMKSWRTVGDNVVRPAHAAVNGTSVPQDQPFNVGGFSMQYPGDPSAPLRLTARCRCRLSFTNDPIPVVASAQEDNLMSMNENVATTYVKILPDFSAWPAEIGITTASGNQIGTLTEAIHYTKTGIVIPGGDSKGTQLSTITISTDDAADGMPDVSEAEVMSDGPAWVALLAVEGVPTEDGRMLAEGSLTWRDLPLSLMALDNTGPGGHEGAIVAGRIDNIWRDGNEVWGEGVFNSDEFGMHIAELVGNQSLRGNSIDPAVTRYEYRDAETGEVVEGDALMDAMMEDRPLITVFLEAIIMASTVCSTPAIASSHISLIR